MIDVSQLMTDPDFASRYTVIRTTGRWVEGRVVLDDPVKLKYFGPVQPATVKEAEELSSGDQTKGIMKFFCKKPRELFITRDLSAVANIDDMAASDEILFLGNIYDIMQVTPWGHFGWLRAFAALKGGIVWHPSS